MSVANMATVTDRRYIPEVPTPQHLRLSEQARSNYAWAGMGKSYVFECSKCGYRTWVCGGADSGHDVRVHTVSCRDCRKLFDVVTAWRTVVSLAANKYGQRAKDWKSRRPPSVEAALRRLPTPALRRTEWLEFALCCPVDPTHKVKAWSDPSRCPRCRNYLERNAVPYRRWD